MTSSRCGSAPTTWRSASRAGEYAANYCTEKNLNPCNIIEIRGLEGSTPAKERGDGFREGIAGNPNAKIIAQQNADWLREKAIPVSQAMFQANPDVNVVYAHNDPMAEAAIISAQNAGLNLDDMLFIGIDALADAGRRHSLGARRAHRRHVRLPDRRLAGDRLRDPDSRARRDATGRSRARDRRGRPRQRPAAAREVRWRRRGSNARRLIEKILPL